MVEVEEIVVVGSSLATSWAVPGTVMVLTSGVGVAVMVCSSAEPSAVGVIVTTSTLGVGVMVTVCSSKGVSVYSVLATFHYIANRDC